MLRLKPMELSSVKLLKEQMHEKGATGIMELNEIIEMAHVSDLTEEKLRSNYGYIPIEAKPPLKKLREKVRCNILCMKSLIFRFMPVLVWLPRYPFLQYIIGDVTSGLTTAIVRIPQGLAYGLLAGVLSINGLYTGFFAPLVYTAFGTSRHVSVGVFSIVSLMLGSALEKVDVDAALFFDGGLSVASSTLSTYNVTSTTMMSPTTAAPPSVADSPKYTDGQNLVIISSLTVLVGIILLGLGICRLGVVSMFLSDPLISAFTTAAAIHVVTAQLKSITGIELTRKSNPFGLVKTYIELFSRISQIQWASVILSAICLSILVPVKYVNRTYKEKLRSIPIPVELFIVILGTVISGAANLNEFYEVKIVGPIDSGMPAPILPKPSLWPALISDAVSIAVVIFAVTVSMGKLFAKKHDYRIDPNQELFALGLCQITCGFFRGHSCSGALARSSVQESSGGNSQVAALVSCVVLLLVLLVIGPLFENLPVACLSCIILANLHGLLTQFRVLPELWKLDVYDFSVWLFTFASVILLGVDLGLMVGLAFSLCCGGLRASRAEISFLGELHGIGQFRNVKFYHAATELHRIKIIQFSQSPTYANKSRLQQITANFLNEQPKINSAPLLQSENLANESHNESDEPAIQRPSKVQIAIFDCSCWSVIDTVGMSTLKSVIKDLTAAGVGVYLASVHRPIYEKLVLSGVVTTDENSLTKVYASMSCAVSAAKTFLSSTSDNTELEVE